MTRRRCVLCGAAKPRWNALYRLELVWFCTPCAERLAWRARAMPLRIYYTADEADAAREDR